MFRNADSDENYPFAPTKHVIKRERVELPWFESLCHIICVWLVLDSDIYTHTENFAETLWSIF